MQMGNNRRGKIIYRILALLAVLLSQPSFADSDWVPSMYEDDYNTQYLEMGLPEFYRLMNSLTPIYIEFTDVIEGRYRVDVEWFPDYGLAPLLTGPANINFKAIDSDISFSVRNELFHVPNTYFHTKYPLSIEYIESKEPIKMPFWYLPKKPFEFRDVNFDGTKELVIREERGGQRFYDSFVVHLIQEGEDVINLVDLSNIEPYKSFDETTEFDWEKQTVFMYYSGGACLSSYELYERVFNENPQENYEFKLIKRIDYDSQDKKGKRIGCHIYVYDVIDGKRVFNEAESGPVN